MKDKIYVKKLVEIFYCDPARIARPGRDRLAGRKRTRSRKPQQQRSQFAINNNQYHPSDITPI